MELPVEDIVRGDPVLRDAVARGDRFRALVRRKLKEAGLPEEGMPVCPAHSRILREAHHEVYKTKKETP